MAADCIKIILFTLYRRKLLETVFVWNNDISIQGLHTKIILNRLQTYRYYISLNTQSILKQ